MRMDGWLHTAGGSIQDETEHVVTLRGVNMFIRLQNERAKFMAAAASGANVVRLMLWKQDIEGNPGAPIAGHDQRGLAAIDNAVMWARDAGLRVILTEQIWEFQVPSAPSAFFSNPALQASWVAMWRTLIDRYRHDDTVIGIDLMNEPWSIRPRPEGAQASWELIAKAAVAELRPRNPNLLFVVSGWGPITEPMWNDVAFLQQPNTVVSDHVYGALSPHGEKTFQYLSTRYAPFTSQGVPIWLGEIGFLPSEQSFMERQLDNFDLLGLHYCLFVFGAQRWASPYDMVDATYTLSPTGAIYRAHLYR